MERGPVRVKMSGKGPASDGKVENTLTNKTGTEDGQNSKTDKGRKAKKRKTGRARAIGSRDRTHGRHKCSHAETKIQEDSEPNRQIDKTPVSYPREAGIFVYCRFQRAD